MKTPRITRSSFLLSLAVVSFAVSACGGYADLMTRKLRQALGRDFREYQAFSYPTDNYGLVTAYAPTGRRISDRDFICDMWNCLGVQQIPEQTSDQLGMNGYAAVGTGGTITLSDREKREVAVKFVLPHIYQVVGVSSGTNVSRTTTTNLRIGSAHVRNLRRNEFNRYMSGLPATHLMKQAFQRGELAVVVSDVVIESMSVQIQVDNTTAQELEAKLEPGIRTKIFEGGSVGVKMSSSQAGTYTFEVTRPVIALRLIKRQPGPGVLAAPDATDDWADWSTIRAQEPAQGTTPAR